MYSDLLIDIIDCVLEDVEATTGAAFLKKCS